MRNAFAAELENASPSPSSSGERTENPSPKNTRASTDRPGGRENRFENRRSRHPYLGGNSRSYGERQNRSETPAPAIQESLPLEPQSETSSDPQQDIITVIQ